MATGKKTEHEGKQCGAFMHITLREDNALLSDDLCGDIFEKMMRQKILTAGKTVSEKTLAEHIFVLTNAVVSYVKKNL